MSPAFPEPLDHALLQDMLVVRTADGEVVAGSIFIGEGEREWFFVPDEPWTEGSYDEFAGALWTAMLEKDHPAHCPCELCILIRIAEDR